MIRTILFALMCCAALYACSVNPKSMAPDLSAQHYPTSGQTLRLAPIDNTLSFRRGAGAITGKKMRETLTLAFGKAGLFRQVVTEGSADLELRVELVQQMDISGRAIGNWELRREMVANYSLIDLGTGQSVWQDSIRTVAGSKALGGAPAIIEATEGAVRENVRALLQAAAQQWPGRNR